MVNQHRRRSSLRSFKKRRIAAGQVGFIDKKLSLDVAFLNVNGLTQKSVIDIQNIIDSKEPDVFGICETHRNTEQNVDKVDFEGYKLFENRREPDEKPGGGIAVYCRTSGGLRISKHTPKYINTDLVTVAKERLWVTVHSESNKTSICFVYVATQYPDDRHAEFNRDLYQLLLSEQGELRRKGHRILFCGDFNGHVGNLPGLATNNNHPVNPNGRRLLEFIDMADFKMVNNMCRKNGSCFSHECDRVCEGTWTWQRGLLCSIIDYVFVSQEHSHCVKNMLIDDKGSLGGDSDHNLLLVSLRDNFTLKKLSFNTTLPKPVWNLTPEQDWSGFTREVLNQISIVDKRTVHTFASSIGSILYNSMVKCFGFKTPGTSRKNPKLPSYILKEITHKRNLLKNWKSLSCQYQRDKQSIPSITPNTCFQEASRLLDDQKTKLNNLLQGYNAAEKLFNDQRVKVSDLLSEFNRTHRRLNIEKCLGNSKSSIRHFWSFLSDKNTKSAVISMVVDEQTGAVKTSPDEIIVEVENYIKSLFNGSNTPPDKSSVNSDFSNDHTYTSPPDTVIPPPVSDNNQSFSDHDYANTGGPKLRSVDQSGSLLTDPVGFMDSDFTSQEIFDAISTLSRDKARGVDNLPNECLIYSPNSFRLLVMELFNKIKNTDSFPFGWTHGRLVLIHKTGPVEFMNNYRPLTVNIAFVSLYSRILNARLSSLVESHDLLGEVQSGFRPGRSCADNSFVLNTILWKGKAEGKNVHCSYVDIKKAYDSVNRERLWEIMTKFGFSDIFINCIKKLYSGDFVTSSVNGSKTRPVYLSRGVRQGCSLSPLLFALYLGDLGSELEKSQHGFALSGKVISALLFADDLVLISRTEKGLKELLKIVLKHCKYLKLIISTTKSKVIYPNANPCTIIDQYGFDALTLDKVVQYKYLGINTFSSMYRTGSEKQKHAIATARRFKGACLNVSRRGPDATLLAATLWTSVAIPSILFGCESIPFSDTTIDSINRIQSQLFKAILSLPISVHNFVAQTEFGIPHFASFLYKQQLNACLKWMQLPNTRWAKLALKEHMQWPQPSPYWSYIVSLKTKLNMPVLRSKSNIRKHVDVYFRKMLNIEILRAKLPSLKPLKRLKRAPYISENNLSSLLVGIKFNYCPKIQCQGVDRQKRCPVCPPYPGKNLPPKSSEFHVNWECSAVLNTRRATGVSNFIMSCDLAGISRHNSFFLYVNGFHLSAPRANLNECLVRAECLRTIRQAWIDRFV